MDILDLIQTTFKVLFSGDDTGTLNNITFNNNIFNNGFKGIILYPTFANNLVISNNDITSDNRGIFIQNFSAPIIIANNITSDSGENAIALFNCILNLNIEQNKIIALSNFGAGIFLSNCQASLANHASIVNNFIQSLGHGILLDQCEYIDIYFNSINIEDFPLTSNASSSAIELKTFNSKIDLQNNILLNRRDGYAYIGKNGFKH